MINIEIERVSGDYGFEAKDAFGNTVRIDTSPETGGNNFGSRPMQLLLMGLGGCSGIDIISILKKQRQEVTGFNAHIEGSRQAGVEPSLWQNVHVVFKLTGLIDPDKAKRACELSMDKYCSVAETLRAAGCELTWEVKVNETSTPQEPAKDK
jgi:putative redox protein